MMPSILDRPTQQINSQEEWFDLLSKTVFAPRAAAAPKPNGPDYCAKPVRCAVCPYPQPCDPQTVRAPKPA